MDFLFLFYVITDETNEVSLTVYDGLCLHAVSGENHSSGEAASAGYLLCQ